MTHYITKQPLSFSSAEELLSFLRQQNPMFLKHYEAQYEAENKGFEVLGMGSETKIQTTQQQQGRKNERNA